MDQFHWPLAGRLERTRFLQEAFCRAVLAQFIQGARLFTAHVTEIHASHWLRAPGHMTLWANQIHSIFCCRFRGFLPTPVEAACVVKISKSARLSGVG